MKHLYSHEEFKNNKLNEAETLIGKFFSDMKSIFGDIKLGKEEQKKVTDFLSMANKDKKNMVNNIKNGLTQLNKTYIDDINKNKDTESVKRITSEYIKTIYAAFDGLAGQQKIDAFKPQNLFKNIPLLKPLSEIKDDKELEAKMPQLVNSVLVSADKDGKFFKEGNTEKKVQNQNTETKNTEETKGNETNTTPTETKGETEGEGVKTESKSYHIFEEATEQQTVKIEDDNVIKEIGNKITNEITNLIVKNFEETAKKIATQSGNVINQLATQRAKQLNSKPENIEKFYNFIANADKETLIKVRDTLSNAKIINKNDFLL